MKVKIILNKVSCVANKACLEKQSEFIEFVSNKANIKGSTPVDGKWERTIDVNKDQLEKLKQAANICPTNSIQVIDQETKEELVQTKVTEQDQIKRINAEYNDETEFVLDPNGYCLIRTHKDTKEIEIAWCDKPNQIKVIVVGKTPLEIYSMFLNKLPGSPFISRFDHAAYLGRELQKAHTCLQLGVEYVQDAELNLDNKK